MKFEVLSSDLQSHLNAISRVLANKNAMPNIDSFLFNITADKLIVTASDLENTMIASIPIANVEGEGRFIVGPKNILDPLKEMPQQTLSFDIDDQNLEVVVQYANGNFNFIVGSAAEYPDLKGIEGETHEMTIGTQALFNGIQSTIFATSDDELRPVMNGIYFDIKPEHTTFVASDSKKLVRLINTKIQTTFEGAFILPKKPATLLRNIINKEIESATVCFDNKSARFSIGDYEIVCRLIEGRYPRYDAVIPKNNINCMTIDRIAFLSAMRRIAVFSNSATNQIKLAIDRNQLTISAQDVDYSTSGIETLTCSYEGTPMSIGFRANYLIEILNTITSQEVEVRLSDPARAGLIAPVENNEGEDLLMLVMPMMLTDF